MGTTAWSFIHNIPADNTSKVLNPQNSNLEPATTYEFQVLCKKPGYTASQSNMGKFTTMPLSNCREDIHDEENENLPTLNALNYPNPNSGNFTIQFGNTGKEDYVIIRVININGQVLSESRHNTNKSLTTIYVDLNGPAGYYSVMIINSEINISKGINISK